MKGSLYSNKLSANIIKSLHSMHFLNSIKVLMAAPWINVKRLQSVTKEVVVPLKTFK